LDEKGVGMGVCVYFKKSVLMFILFILSEEVLGEFVTAVYRTVYFVFINTQGV
jgi:hypothetical protein